MKTGIGQSKYRSFTLFHVVWSVPAKVFLTVTFSKSKIFSGGSSWGARGARALRSPLLSEGLDDPLPPPLPPPPYLKVWIRPWYFHFFRLPGSWSKRRIFFTFSESVNSGRKEHCHLNFLRYFRHCTTCSWVEKIQFKHLEIKLNLIFAFFWPR